MCYTDGLRKYFDTVFEVFNRKMKYAEQLVKVMNNLEDSLGSLCIVQED